MARFNGNCASIGGHATNKVGKCTLCGKMDGKCYSCGKKIKNTKYSECFGCFRAKVSGSKETKKVFMPVEKFYGQA